MKNVAFHLKSSINLFWVWVLPASIIDKAICWNGASLWGKLMQTTDKWNPASWKNQIYVAQDFAKVQMKQTNTKVWVFYAKHNVNLAGGNHHCTFWEKHQKVRSTHHLSPYSSDSCLFTLSIFCISHLYSTRDTKKTIKSPLLRLFILCLFKNYLDSSQVEKRGWACLYFRRFHVSTDSMYHEWS